MRIPLRWRFNMKKEIQIRQIRKDPREKTRQESYPQNRVFLFCGLCALVMLISCASPARQLPPPPPKYVSPDTDLMVRPTRNSLWNDSRGLFVDTKAARLNDLVTIRIIENLTGSGTADTDTSRESSAHYELENLFGMNNDFNLQNAFLLKNMYKGANIFEPEVAGNAKSEFKGEGETNREGELVATITAKIVEVLDNGNYILESRKEMTINNERQILVMTGMVRPEDITSENIVLSTKIADARIYYVGDGVIQDKQSPGWLVRVLDNLWMF
jgi:flagellar L-ring protein precursor FlgH